MNLICPAPPPPPLRIKVDLTEMGITKVFWYLVNPSPSASTTIRSARRRACDTIGQLRRDIRRRFSDADGRRRHTEVWMEGALVPDDESVALLAPNDTINIVPSERAVTLLSEENHDIDRRQPKKAVKRRRTSESSSPTCNGIETETENEVVVPEVVHESPELKKKKKKKKKKSEKKRRYIEEDVERQISDDEDDAGPLVLPDAASSSKRKTVKESPVTVDKEEVDTDIVKCPDVDSVEPNKQRRKERMKLRRKEKRARQQAEKKLAEIQRVPDPVEPRQVSCPTSPVRSSVNGTSTHIRFDEVDDAKHHLNDNDGDVVQRNGWEHGPHEKNPNSKCPVVNREGFNGQTRNRDFKMAERDVLTNKSIVMQNPINREEAISVGTVPEESERVKPDYSRYQLLEGPPRVNDIICYKVLELSENYTPEVSDYKVGKVLKYDSVRHEVLLEFPEPIELKSKRGKFELIWETNKEDGAEDDDDDDAEDEDNADEYNEPSVFVTEMIMDVATFLETRLIDDSDWTVSFRLGNEV